MPDLGDGAASAPRLAAALFASQPLATPRRLLALAIIAVCLAVILWTAVATPQPQWLGPFRWGPPQANNSHAMA